MFFDAFSVVGLTRTIPFFEPITSKQKNLRMLRENENQP